MKRPLLATSVTTMTSLMTLLFATRAVADCMPPNRFAAAEHAARVAVVRIGNVNASFTATGTVEDVLKGDATPKTVEIATNPMLGTTPLAGRRYLFFFDTDGKKIEACATTDVKVDAALLATLRTYLKTNDASTRALLLVKSGISEKHEALAQLAQSPALLVTLTKQERALLLGAIGKLDDERAYALALVLGKLHATESIDAWQKFLSKPHPNVNERPIQDALELMANRHDARYTVGTDFYGEVAQAIHDGWKVWLAENQPKTPDAIVTAGFASRKVIIPPGKVWTERAVLQKLISDKNDDLTRLVALNECELQRKAPTSRIGVHTMARYIDWAAAQAACAD